MPKNIKRKNDAEKREHEKKLAAARQRRRKANMTEEELEKKRQRDRERYHRLKAEKKIKLASEMTPKELNNARKKWKKKKALQKKRKEDEKKLMENTPQTSDIEDYIPTSRERESRQKAAGRKIVRRDRAKVYRDLKKKTEENEVLKRKLLKYKKRLEREKKKKNKETTVISSPTPTKKLKQIIGQEKVSPHIKKRLFVGLALEKQLKDQMKSVKPKTTEKKVITRVIGSKIIKKYRIQRQLADIVSYKASKKIVGDMDSLTTLQKRTYNTLKVREAKAITQFFEDDTVSKMLPGKKDFVRNGKIKKQRRLLLDSLLNLYHRFVKESDLKISYTTFCRTKPFWVTRPKQKDRETCACIRHENFQFLATALKKSGVLEHDKVGDFVKEVVCSSSNEKCMMGRCNKCKLNEIQFLNEEDDVDVEYNEWASISSKKIIKGVEKVVKRVVKVSKVEKASSLQDKFDKELSLFKKHVYSMKHQASSLKKLKENLQAGQLLFQVDFSQNYIAKCSTEIQSMHFGASKRQISLHTGAMYFVGEDGEVQCKTFCTASDNLDHHAYGVWAHMNPILEEASQAFPDTKVIHVFSDSPSSQYRNRFNVFLMQELLPKHFKHLESFTWNFSEPGHGKGVMDGVGGSIKRNADQKVLQGIDITCASDLVALFQTSKTKVFEISSSSVEEVKQSLPKDIPVLKGIMSVRQVYWDRRASYMFGRKLSCFECTIDKREKCNHFHLFTLNFDESAASNIKVKKNKKSVMKVSEVYSSSSEDSFKEDSLITPAPFSYDDLKLGVYVVVSFPTGKKTLNFVAVTQGEVQPDREIQVMFMKPYGGKSTFKTDENDISYVSCDQILGILPQPDMLINGERILWKFKNDVAL